MRKRALALTLGILFFGGITSSTVAMVTESSNFIVRVDNDKDKNKKSTKSKEDCPVEAIELQ